MGRAFWLANDVLDKMLEQAVAHKEGSLFYSDDTLCARWDSITVIAEDIDEPRSEQAIQVRVRLRWQGYDVWVSDTYTLCPGDQLNLRGCGGAMRVHVNGEKTPAEAGDQCHIGDLPSGGCSTSPSVSLKQRLYKPALAFARWCAGRGQALTLTLRRWLAG